MMMSWGGRERARLCVAERAGGRRREAFAIVRARTTLVEREPRPFRLPLAICRPEEGSACP